jgi:hypothetical protein
MIQFWVQGWGEFDGGGCPQFWVQGGYVVVAEGDVVPELGLQLCVHGGYVAVLFAEPMGGPVVVPCAGVFEAWFEDET